MRTKVTIVTVVAVILILSRFGNRPLFPEAPKKAAVVKRYEEGRIILEAGRDYLSQLRQEGRLPGQTTNDHGIVSVDGTMAYYPYSLTMRFKEGEASTNNYTIVQIKKDSPWQLKRAWQTDSNDQIIQEWAVK